MADLNRREILVAGAGAGAIGLAGSLAILPTPAARAAGDGAYRYRIGDVEVIAIHDGFAERPLEAGFVVNAELADVQAALAEAGHPTDKVTINFTQTVMRIGDRTVLIDAGTGAQLAPTAGKMMENLAAAGIDPASIDTVLVSHFHPDHIFGLMAKDTNAQVFPNAEIVVPEAELAFWTDPSLIERLPEGQRGLAQRIQATLGTWGNVRPVAGGTEVAPGLVTRSAHGHTPGHTVHVLSSGNDTLVIAADTANLPALFVANPGWHVAFDMDKAMAEASRRALLDMVVADGAVIAGYHFGFPNPGRIEKDGEGYAFVPLGA